LLSRTGFHGDVDLTRPGSYLWNDDGARPPCVYAHPPGHGDRATTAIYADFAPNELHAEWIQEAFRRRSQTLRSALRGCDVNPDPRFERSWRRRQWCV
jgi:hypothetical protein